MAFLRYKQRGTKFYVYSTQNIWDKSLKKYKQHSVYLGVATEKGGEYTKTSKTSHEVTQNALKGVVDFGDGYAITQILKNDGLEEVVKLTLPDPEAVMSLMAYQLISGSAMYNFTDFASGNIISHLYPSALSLSSQKISNFLKQLGKPEVHDKFFKAYITKFFSGNHGILIDSTALPSSINSSLSSFGYSADGIVQKVGCLALVDKLSKLPIFFRAIPGEIADVSTLSSTIEEIRRLGLAVEDSIFDAGYFSENNVKFLCEQNIKFLSRMPRSRKAFRQLVLEAGDLEKSSNGVLYGEKRAVFIKSIKTRLYENELYAHIIMDPEKRGHEITRSLRSQDSDDLEEADFKYAGIFILISNYEISKEDILPSYYTRQSIEQIFGFAKSNNLLPLRVHDDYAIRGYLLLVFLSIIVFVQLRQKLGGDYTVEQALLILRNLKSKMWGTDIIVQEMNKKTKNIFAKLNITVPITPGI